MWRVCKAEQPYLECERSSGFELSSFDFKSIAPGLQYLNLLHK